MKVLSLFDGISCGRVALERAGIKVDQYVAYEIEESAIKISKHNYPDIIQNGDVYKADFTKFQGFDLLIGGSPCTYWSIAKAGHGRETSSSGIGFDLFMQYVRAKEESGCKWFIYENNYSISQEIKDEISRRLGVQPIMINLSLVSAQSRKRCYWTNIPNVTQPKDKGIKLQDILIDGYADRDKSLCLTRRYAGFRGSQSFLTRRYFGKSFGQAKFTSQEARDVVRNKWLENPYFESALKEIQPLTVKECERLQTLPDGYTNVDGISSYKAIEAIGNGWTVDVIVHIINCLKEYLKNNTLI